MEPPFQTDESETVIESTTLGEALASLFNNPLIGVFSAMMIPFLIIGYSLFAMRIHPNMAGLLDHTLFVLLFFLIFNFILCIPSALRVLVSFGFVMAVAFFFLSNTLYFRFFNSWGQFEVAKMWRDVPPLLNGIVALAHATDYVFYFLLPLFFWQLSLRSFLLLTRRTTVVLIAAVIGVLATHQSVSSEQLNYMENNPLFYMMREQKMQMSLTLSHKKVKIDKSLSRYQLINNSLYVTGTDADYPFLKTPKPGITPLPMALTSKPNVILILMESIRAYEIGAYGSNPSYMPNFDAMAKESLFFKNFYALGTQTIRGEFSIHTSYNPDVLGGPVYVNNPTLSVMTLPMVLKQHGYRTHWMEAECGSFTNRKIQFLSRHGVDFFHTDVPINHPPLGMGAADEDTFDHALNIFSKEKQPFFAEIMTLSNHWTFEADFPTISKTPPSPGNTDYRNYTRGIYYTDYALGKFIEKARKTTWGKNTIFLITGDHGIWYFPDQPGFENVIRRKEMYFRSPFLIWAPKLLKPQVIETLGSHLDITPTVLDLLNIHVPNPFMGTSLLRNDTDTRFVFLTQDGRWNLRYGNEYVFDEGPEIFASLPPFNLPEYLKQVRGKKMQYAHFETDHDLLRDWEPEQIQTLPKKRAGELQKFAEDAIAAYHTVIFRNRIHRPEK